MIPIVEDRGSVAHLGTRPLTAHQRRRTPVKSSATDPNRRQVSRDSTVCRAMAYSPSFNQLPDGHRRSDASTPRMDPRARAPAGNRQGTAEITGMACPPRARSAASAPQALCAPVGRVDLPPDFVVLL